MPRQLLRICATLCGAILPVVSIAQNPRPVPPPGIPIPDDIRAELEQGARDLGFEVAKLKKDFHADPEKLAEIPNVEIFHKAVDWALRYGEFFEPKQFDVARSQLEQGVTRAKDLRSGKTPWKSANGLVVRAYRSAIDGSVQPYGLVIPADWNPETARNVRCTFGSMDAARKLSELAFIQDRQYNKGEIHSGGRHRAAPLRTLLQREQVRWRSRRIRSHARGREQLSHRPATRSDTRLLHGRCKHVANGDALSGTMGCGRAGRGVLGNTGVLQILLSRQAGAALVGDGPLGLVRRNDLRAKSGGASAGRLQRRDRWSEASG
jgi:hypothetical protein